VGAGVALLAGLLTGAAMQPVLAVDDGPAGPQIIAALHGARTADPFTDATPAFAGYSDRIPDYVLGTDWARLTSVPAEPPPAHEDSVELAYDAAATAQPVADIAPAIDEEAPPEAAGDTTPAPMS
jgi:hypothetical protein